MRWTGIRIGLFFDRTGAGVVALMLLVGLTLAACGNQSAKSAPPQGAPPEVGIVVVRPERVAITSELAGRTSPYLIAEVRPQVGGIIQKRLFIEGADIKAGEALYQIDPASYRAAYSSAKAALSRAEANLAPARLKAERYKELAVINAVSRQDNDEAVASLKQAEADVEAAAAALETARIHLGYASISSPISGRIGRSAVTTGALVTANQAGALATIQQLDPIYVDVTQSSAELLRLKQNQAAGQFRKSGLAKVKLLLEDGRTYPVSGTLKFSDVTVDQDTGSVTLRAVFPNPENLLLPGMYVRAVIEEGVNEKAILVPQQAVSRGPKGEAVVMLVNASGTVEPRPVMAERAIGDKWLVTGGLAAGDRVIVEGLQKARPGSPVKAVPAGASGGAVQAAGK
jgi:membrane fusion protein (multidrug efflux system)